MVWHELPQHALPAQQEAPQVSGDDPPHPQLPFVQLWPAAHACPQAPQFAGFVVVSTQAPEQFD